MGMVVGSRKCGAQRARRPARRLLRPFVERKRQGVPLACWTDFSPQGTASNRRVSPGGYRYSAGGLQGSLLDVLSGRLDSLRRLPGIFLAGPVVPCFWGLRGVSKVSGVSPSR